MSGFRLNELESLISIQMSHGEPFRIHFEPTGDGYRGVLIDSPHHCPTCQCNRAIDIEMPKGPEGASRRCSWHHD